MICNKKKNHVYLIPSLGKRLIFNESTKYLGVCIDKHLIWKSQISVLAKKLRRTKMG